MRPTTMYPTTMRPTTLLVKERAVIPDTKTSPPLSATALFETLCAPPDIPPLPEVCTAEIPQRILIVDDSDFDRKAIRRFLPDACEIHETGCVEQCKALVQRHTFHAIFLDYKLPDGDGPSGIQEIRQLAKDENLPIIVLTGFGDEQKAIESFHDGASDYIPKDVMSPAVLKRALDNATQKASLQRRVDEQHQTLLRTNVVLQRQNEEIQSFYQTVSHELKTPLTAAREYAALVRDGVVGVVSQEQKDLLDRAIFCCDSLKILVNDLLDAAQFENGNLAMHRELADLEQIVRLSVDAISQLPQNESLSVSVRCAENIPQLNIDSQRLIQVFSNLLNNASKFTEGSCEVQIDIAYAKGSRDFIEIAVADNGPGIRKDSQKLVFDKFFQVDAGSSSGHTGMGLGLYLCSRIIEAHSGSICIDPAWTSGCRFLIQLPVSDAGKEL